MARKKMNPRVKGNWLKWLRSGQYSQTKNVLCKEASTGNCSFCCHGVLSNIHAEETGGHWTEAEFYASYGVIVYGLVHLHTLHLRCASCTIWQRIRN